MRPMRPPAAVPSAECLTTGQRYRVVPGRPLRLIPTDERGPADVYSPGGQSEETVGKPAWFYVVFSDTEPSVTVDAEDVAALP